MKPFHLVIAALLFALPTAAQTQDKLRAELRTKETAAKQDVDQLLEVAKWADEKGLPAEAKRIAQTIVKLKPDHEGANRLLGNVQYEGKWMPQKDADAMRKKAQEAEFKAKGLVEVKGVWVDKDKVADANKGIFWFEGDRVTREELLALQGGKVRHPQTGELINAADKDKADKQFMVGDNRWVDEKEADDYHHERAHPWVLRTFSCVLIGSLPFKTMQDVKAAVDEGYQRARSSGVFGNMEPAPADRPVILVAGTDEEFSELGKRMGDETSSFGAFLSRPGTIAKVALLGESRPLVCHWHKVWGPYYAKHAAGLGYCQAICEETSAEVPAWFRQGLGSLASRYSDPRVAGGFGEMIVQKGGVKDLKTWFNSFAISGDMEYSAVETNINLAGLILSFAMRGGDAKVTEAMLEVTKEVTSGRGKTVDKAIEKLQKLICDHEEQVRAYLKKIVQDKDR
jgi:hypothetical protein